MSPDAKTRILDAALACFAARGYAATTITDIEQAAGMSPGAGGTYRHFRSKRAILEAAIDAELAVNDEVLAPAPVSLDAAARDALKQLDHQRNLTRVLFRDLDEFPDLQRRIVERLIQGPYRLVAERTAVAAPKLDAEAIAVLMVGSLVNVKVIEAMTGELPGGVSEDRLVEAWASLFALAIKAGR
jgi:AcrR family transcriptional regulator